MNLDSTHLQHSRLGLCHMLVASLQRDKKPPNECVEYDIKQHLMLRIQSKSLGYVEYTFIAITPRYTLIQTANTCLGQIEMFNHLLRWKLFTCVQPND